MGKIYFYPRIKEPTSLKTENREKSSLTALNQKTNALNTRISEEFSKPPMQSKQYRLLPKNADPEAGFGTISFIDDNELA